MRALAFQFVRAQSGLRGLTGWFSYRLLESKFSAPRRPFPRGWKSGCRFQDFNLALEAFQLGANLIRMSPVTGPVSGGIGILLRDKK